MAVTVNQKHGEDDEVRQFLIGLARGTAGALLFALPMLMTMEMWFLGLYVNSWRLLLLCILNLPLLLLLARRIGFENINSWSQALRDAITAYGLGIAVSAGVLLLFGILNDQAHRLQYRRQGRAAIRSRQHRRAARPQPGSASIPTQRMKRKASIPARQVICTSFS